mmetsp:Transcript_92455/g.135132  ORF Transcript_92455/g.135132 Transcript_92455/m.135132 type:complete len:176 (-) Transcript_92455:52-579(-)
MMAKRAASVSFNLLRFMKPRNAAAPLARSFSTPAVVVGQSPSSSSVWNPMHFTRPEGTPEGFKLRAAPAVSSLPTADQSKSVEVFLETWEAGSAEPPHAHPGDDMTVVVEGHMRIQFFKPDGAEGKLVPDGIPVDLVAGQTGLIEANRIHDAKYITECKLVYVHNSAFGFEEKTV